MTLEVRIQIALIAEDAPTDGAGVAERGNRSRLQLCPQLLLLLFVFLFVLLLWCLAIMLLQLEVHAASVYGMKAHATSRHCAAVGLLARMQSPMDRKVVSKAESLATDVALVGSLLGVYDGVHAQLAQLSESLAALPAHMWPLIGVRHPVNAQRVSVAEAARANVADVARHSLCGRGTFTTARWQVCCGKRWRRR